MYHAHYVEIYVIIHIYSWQVKQVMVMPGYGVHVPHKRTKNVGVQGTHWFVLYANGFEGTAGMQFLRQNPLNDSELKSWMQEHSSNNNSTSAADRVKIKIP